MAAQLPASIRAARGLPFLGPHGSQFHAENRNGPGRTRRPTGGRNGKPTFLMAGIVVSLQAQGRFVGRGNYQKSTATQNNDDKKQQRQNDPERSVWFVLDPWFLPVYRRALSRLLLPHFLPSDSSSPWRSPPSNVSLHLFPIWRFFILFGFR